MIIFNKAEIRDGSLILLREVARLPVARVVAREVVVNRPARVSRQLRWRRGSFVSAPVSEREMFDRDNHIA
jgi:hypothetical protein